MVQKIHSHPAHGCNRSPLYYVFSKYANLGSVSSICSEVLERTHLSDAIKSCRFSFFNMYQIYIYFCWLLLLATYDVCIHPPYISLHALNTTFFMFLIRNKRASYFSYLESCVEKNNTLRYLI